MKEKATKKSKMINIKSKTILISIALWTSFLVPITGAVNYDATDDVMAGMEEQAEVTAVDGGGDLKSVTLQPGEDLGKDTYIKNSSSANEGERYRLLVGNSGGYEWRPLIQFTLPHDLVKLEYATLKLYSYSHSGRPNVTVRALSSEWDEGTGDGTVDMAANWTHRTDSEIWSDEGGDYYSTPKSYRYCDIDNIWYSWDVTDIVDLWLSGTRDNNGFILQPGQYSSGSDYIYFYSSNHSDASLYPKLTLTYSTEIDPPVPSQTMNEDSPTKDISLRDREHETLTNISDMSNAWTQYPFWGSAYDECRIQNVFTPEQVGSDGIIRRISFKRREPPTVGNFSNLKIYLGHTHLDELTTTFADNYHGGMVEVFSAADYELNSSNDNPWVHFDLNESFWYDSSYNLLLELTWNGDGDIRVDLEAREYSTKVVKIISGALTSPTGSNSTFLQITRFETEIVKDFTRVSGPHNRSANSIPLWGNGLNVDEMHFQTLYTPDQVGAEGDINRISFQRIDKYAAGNFSNFQISLAHTEMDSLTNTFADNYDGYLVEVFPPQEVGWDFSYTDIWIHFELNDNFTYDNQHNLLVDIKWKGDGGDTILLNMTNKPGNIRVYNTTDITASTGSVDAFTPTPQPVARFETDIIQNAVLDNGTTTTIWPLNPTSSTETHCQMLYNQTLLKEKGILDKISFQAADGSPEWALLENFSIRVAHSSRDTLDPNFESNRLDPWVEVLNQSAYNMTTTGRPEWIEVDIEDIFTYNGEDNLLIDMRWRGGDTFDGALDLKEYNTAWYDAFLRSTSYSAASGTAWPRIYNLQATFLHERSYSWSASSSDNSLFTASTSGNWLDGWDLHITPQPDAFGSGTCILRLHNSQGKTAIQRIPVTINNINDQPILSGPSSVECDEDVDKVVDMSPHVTDIDNTIDEMSFTTNSSYATTDGYNITFTYPQEVTSEKVKITVDDSSGGSDTFTANITVNQVNDPPELSGPSDIECDEDVDYVLNMTDYASDVDNDIANLTYDTNSTYATVDGHLITFNYPEGVLSEIVNITVEDPDGATGYTVVEVTVNPVNDAPILDGVPDIECTEGEEYILNLTSYVSDIDNEISELTFDTNSSYATINGTQIIFLYTGGIEHEVVNITVEDPGGLTDYDVIEATITLTGEYPSVVSHAPTGSGVAPTRNIIVEFSMEMDEVPTESAFSLMMGTTEISGTFSWNTAGTTMTFDPSSDLTDGDYTATVSTAARSTAGTNLPSEHSWTFSVSTEDTDGDGIPDAYEEEHGLDPNDPSDADGDADGDGVSNLEEYNDGTDPNDADDFVSDDEDEEDEGFFSPWILLLILAAIIVLILVIVLVKKRGGEEEYPEQETQQYQQPPPPEQTSQEQPPYTEEESWEEDSGEYHETESTPDNDETSF